MPTIVISVETTTAPCARSAPENTSIKANNKYAGAITFIMRIPISTTPTSLTKIPNRNLSADIKMILTETADISAMPRQIFVPLRMRSHFPAP